MLIIKTGSTTPDVPEIVKQLEPNIMPGHSILSNNINHVNGPRPISTKSIDRLRNAVKKHKETAQIHGQASVKTKACSRSEEIPASYVQNKNRLVAQKEFVLSQKEYKAQVKNSRRTSTVNSHDDLEDPVINMGCNGCSFSSLKMRQDFKFIESEIIIKSIYEPIMDDIKGLFGINHKKAEGGNLRTRRRVTKKRSPWFQRGNPVTE